MFIEKYYFVSKCLRFKSLTYILKPKNLNYLQFAFSIVNDGNASLLNNIINKSHIQLVIIQKEQLLEKLTYTINENYWQNHRNIVKTRPAKRNKP